MHTDDDFLREIEQAPADRTLRLIYADWLDEGKSVRGELVRVEEEMRELPVFSDRFWELKRRRNSLQAATDAGWLERMKYGTEGEPVFRHGLPDGWRQWWRLVREFADRWYRQPLPDVGGRQAEIAEAERGLGRVLPPSVREWVAFAHDMCPNPRTHGVIRDAYQMTPLAGHDALSLLLQAEGDYHWAVRYGDLDAPDPPVHGYHWSEESEDIFVPAERNPIHDAVSDFAFSYVSAYVRGGGGGFGTDIVHPEPLLRELATFPVRAQVGPTRIYEMDNLCVFVNPSHWQPGGVRIRVELFKQLPRDAIPAFLWEYTRGGGSFHGAFVPE